MRTRSKYPQLANIVFLDKVGETLRDVTSHIPKEELPEEIRLLLRKLEGVENGKRQAKPSDRGSGENGA